MAVCCLECIITPYQDLPRLDVTGSLFLFVTQMSQSETARLNPHVAVLNLVGDTCTLPQREQFTTFVREQSPQRNSGIYGHSHDT